MPCCLVEIRSRVKTMTMIESSTQRRPTVNHLLNRHVFHSFCVSGVWFLFDGHNLEAAMLSLFFPLGMYSMYGPLQT